MPKFTHIIPFVLWGLSFPIQATEISGLCIKNNNSYPVFVWVNDQPQGLAPARKTCYVPREGFVTSDSGLQPDGSNKQAQANGGWAPTPTITVKAAGWTVKKKKDGNEESALIVWNGSGVAAANDAGDALVWLGSPALTEEDRENAEKLPSGTPLQNMIETLPKAVNSPPDKEVLAAGFSGAEKPVMPLWTGAGDKKKFSVAGDWKVTNRNLYYRLIADSNDSSGKSGSACEAEYVENERLFYSSYYEDWTWDGETLILKYYYGRRRPENDNELWATKILKLSEDGNTLKGTSTWHDGAVSDLTLMRSEMPRKFRN